MRIYYESPGFLEIKDMEVIRRFSVKTIVVVLVLLQLYAIEVLGKKKKRSRAARYNKETVDYKTPMYMMAFLLFMIFAPVIGIFIRSVYKDPATPEVVKAG